MLDIGYRDTLLKGPLSHWLNHARWIAALLVAMAHLRSTLFPDVSTVTAALYPFYFVNLFGEQAVVIFFVMSGLLVGGMIFREKDNFSFSSYLVRRGVRLYLVLVPAVVLAVGLSLAFPQSCHLPDSVARVAGNLLFLQNLTTSPLCNDWPLWSLSSEGLFYVIAPLAILGIAHRSLARLLTFAAALLFAFIVSGASHTNPAFGILLWFCGLIPWFVRIPLPAIVGGGLFLGCLLASRLHLFPNAYVDNAVLALAFSAMLCCKIQSVSAPFAKLSETLSQASYSLYLVHVPIYASFASVYGTRSFAPSDWRGYAVYAALLALVLFVAFTFGRAFEGRALRQSIVSRIMRVLPQGPQQASRTPP